VCTDLYDGFINAVEQVLPQAKIVADRFHIAKLYRAAIDALRKIEMKAGVSKSWGRGLRSMTRGDTGRIS
jgi:transposase